LTFDIRTHTIPRVKHSPNEPKPRTPGKSRFLAALRIAGITMSQWADDQGVTQGYVSNVLAGRHISKSMSEKIAAFTEQQLGKVA
jgi:hypothetical protein